ncbi:hypothetical protein CDEST_08358 [Colletotrichum destructivum]|uniref:Uncharacterized protein n=1 Tax=Colletotrichum destructivum TaxID=34406 RepID=A0AAX4IJ13_9PEZI|nr:hypothetical protein CDEST_08358 [Colletotrichum destructivum]
MGLESQQTSPVLACKVQQQQVQQQQVQSESSPVSRHSERPVSAQHRATQLVSAERCDRARRDYVMAAAKESRRNPAETICLFDNDKTEKMNRQDGWGRCCEIDTRWASVAWMGCTTAVTQGSHWPERGIFLACKTWARRTRAARTPPNLRVTRCRRRQQQPPLAPPRLQLRICWARNAQHVEVHIIDMPCVAIRVCDDRDGYL